MKQEDVNQFPPAATPPGPTCPACGTRVAARAATCFMCGARIGERPRTRWRVPWSDLMLLAVIVGTVVFWWTRSPAEQPSAGAGSSLLAPGAAQAAADTGSSAPSAMSMAEPVAMLSPAPAATATLTPTMTPTPTATPVSIIYTIVSGDSLLGIAGKLGVDLNSILSANKISGNAILRIGQKLVIPTAGMKPEALSGSVTPAPTATPDDTTLIYRVQPGDSIAAIASRYKSSINDILRANKLDPSSILPVGQVLVIPRGTPTATPTATAAATPSPTPGPALPAPVLLGPANGATLAATEPVVLRWTAAGALGEQDWYAVRVWSQSSDVSQPTTFYTRGTSMRLAASLRPPDVVTERGWQWLVVVVHMPESVPAPEPLATAANSPGPAPLAGQQAGSLPALSAVSEIRGFIWK